MTPPPLPWTAPRRQRSAFQREHFPLPRLVEGTAPGLQGRRSGCWGRPGRGPAPCPVVGGDCGGESCELGAAGGEEYGGLGPRLCSRPKGRRLLPAPRARRRVGGRDLGPGSAHCPLPHPQLLSPCDLCARAFPGNFLESQGRRERRPRGSRRGGSSAKLSRDLWEPLAAGATKF